MSKHWNPRDVRGAPGRRGGWPRAWDRYRSRQKRPAFSRGEIRLTLLAGLIAGLAYASLTPGGGEEAAGNGSVFAEGATAFPDPYAEAKRSAEILRAQEGAPPPVAADVGPRRAAEGLVRNGMVDVIDGDTFRYGGQKIRIADIDTPEVEGRCAYETALAARATRRLAELLAAGPFSLESIGGDEDQYGRKLRIVTRQGRSLGDQLVAEGLARTWTGRREPWCA